MGSGGGSPSSRPAGPRLHGEGPAGYGANLAGRGRSGPSELGAGRKRSSGGDICPGAFGDRWICWGDPSPDSVEDMREKAAGAAVAAMILLSACADVSAGRAPERAHEDVVRTDTGAVRGTVTGEHRIFQGIPYAAPPVGELRWNAPAPVRAWNGIREATRPGSHVPAGGKRLREDPSSDGGHLPVPKRDHTGTRPDGTAGDGVGPRRRSPGRRALHRRARIADPGGRGGRDDQLPARGVRRFRSSGAAGDPAPTACRTSRRRCAGYAATPPRSAGTRRM